MEDHHKANLKEVQIGIIESKFRDIMQALNLDLRDDSLKDSPGRVAKMFVNEIFSGLYKEEFPKISTFKNNYNYDQMLIESNIEVNSYCEHHFVPILGRCHIAYIPSMEVIGLSKLNRIAQYFGKRPQVQERLTSDIFKKLQEILKTEDVAVVMDAKHLCVKMRGVKDSNSETRSIALGGRFRNDEKTRAEFMNSIPRIS